MRSIAIATEDELSEYVGERLAAEAGLKVNIRLRRNGNGYLRGSIKKFAEMAINQPVLLITDLDLVATADQLKKQWLKDWEKKKGLLFHVAVREVESWILADHKGIKKLLGEKIGKLPEAPELLSDPKAKFLSLAAKAPRELRNELLAERNSMASQGLGYNSLLGSFVKTVWQPKLAAERSPSLAALMTDLASLS